MCAKDIVIRSFQPTWVGEFELLDRALRAGSLTVEPDSLDRGYAARVRALHESGLVSQIYRPPGARAASTYVITDGGRIAWRRDAVRASRLRDQLAGTMT